MDADVCGDWESALGLEGGIVILGKREAWLRGIRQSEMCFFHIKNPDQNGVYSCKECFLIREPCGCDEDMGCVKCEELNTGVWRSI